MTDDSTILQPNPVKPIFYGYINFWEYSVRQREDFLVNKFLKLLILQYLKCIWRKSVAQNGNLLALLESAYSLHEGSQKILGNVLAFLL